MENEVDSMDMMMKDTVKDNLKCGLLEAINNPKSYKNALSIFLENKNQELDLFDFMLHILQQTNQV